MEQKIIADSCCDMTAELKKRLGLTLVPLTIRLAEKDYVDDDDLDMDEFMRAMASCETPGSTSCPSPNQYQEQFESGDEVFAVTLSEKLSGSYSSAILGKAMAEENGAGDIHVIDSKSACAGEVLIAIKIREMIEKGLSGEGLASKIRAFADTMKTYFVLDNLNNLLKNGRLNKITGRLITLLNMKLVLGADGNGEIGLFAKVWGAGRIVSKMLEMIDRSGKETEGETIVISHCRNIPLAEELAGRVKERFRFKEIVVVPTGGLSSFYADDKGIVMAF